MTTNFDHVLLTRFNVYMGEALGPPAKRLEDDWLKRRIVEFETFCLPSVRAQTEKNFTWIIFCDPDSPQWFRDYMTATDDFVAVFSNEVRRASTGRLISDLGFASRDFLISSRLDNDDAISKDFIESVQSRFEGQNRAFVDFPLGLRAYRGGLFSAVWRSNPFISMIESRGHEGAFQSVFAFQHDLIKQSESVVSVWGRPRWVRSMHDANTVTTAVGIPRFKAQSVHFDCRWDLLRTQPSFLVRCTYSVRGYVARLMSRRRVRQFLAAIGGRGSK